MKFVNTQSVLSGGKGQNPPHTPGETVRAKQTPASFGTEIRLAASFHQFDELIFGKV